MSSIVRPQRRPVGQRGLQAGRTARSLCALHERITGRVPDVQRRSRPPARAAAGGARAGGGAVRRVPVRRACVLYVGAVRGCVWIFQRFGFSSARAHGACSLCYLTRALIRLRPRTVTARDGTMPRTCGRGSSRAPEPSVPVRSGSGRPATLRYIYLASNTAAPPSFKTRAPHLTQTCIRAHTRCEASLAIGTKGAIERRGSVASILTILDGIKGSQPNHMRASPCF